MMRSKAFVSGIFTLASLCIVAGCGGSSASTETTSADDDLMKELLGTEDQTREPAEPEDDVSRAADDLAFSERPSRQESARAASQKRTGPKGEALELRLQTGDRFPLIKTVEQTLEQKSTVAPAMARTRLELTMAITVEDERPDAILLNVHYGRVVYAHDISGQRLEYDSQSHQGAVPWDAIPYAGMVGNGFSFWLGRDNRIRELVGYQEFLERCVAEVPLERRQTLLAELSHRFGDDGVANFVDDSIGLLPYDSSVDPEAATHVMPGDVWTRERRLMQPVPVYLTSTYTLSSMNDRTAEIEITGRIASGEAVQADGPGRVRVSAGRSMGNCVVDRATGLPMEMQLTRNMTIHVTTETNEEVVQEKQILTTIRAFPETRGPVVSRQHGSAIQQVTGRSDDNGVTRIPVTDEQSKPVRAVYPGER